MSAAHTPGPWINMGTEVVGPVNSGITVARMPDCEPSKRHANARLIAAAPDLLEAIQALMSSTGEQLATAFEMAEKAIAKATGGAA